MVTMIGMSRRLRRVLGVVLASMLVATVVVVAPATAQDGTVAAVDTAFGEWLKRHNLRRGSFAVSRAGKVVHTGGVDMPADADVPVASLSKAITAICVAKLIDAGKLAFDTPISQALEKTIVRLGPPADERLATATINQLLTHRAGFQLSRETPDPASGPALAAHLRRKSGTDPAIDDITRAVLGSRLPQAPGMAHGYTNATYLLLGAAIEEASGKSYESHCAESVPGLAGAKLHPAWRVLSSYGGWHMPLRKYLQIHEAFADDSPALSPTTRRWQASAPGKEVANGVHYGLGSFVRPAGRSANYWHGGRWHYRLEDAADGPLMSSYGAYVVRLGGLFSWSVWFSPAVPDAGFADLESTMIGAGQNVGRWP